MTGRALTIIMLFAITTVAPEAPAAISYGNVGVPINPTEPVLIAEPLPSAYQPALKLTAEYGEELTLRVGYRCTTGADANILYRKTGTGSYVLDRELEDCSGVLTITDVEPAILHCYKIESTHDGGRYSDQHCVKPKYLRVSFRNPLISPNESNRVLEEFDWLRTDPLQENFSETHEFADLPILYHMNILIDKEYKVETLRGLGIHIQSDPLFMDELSGWSDGLALAAHDGSIKGRWYFALVPGTVYNALRQASIESIYAGEELPVIAAVFRQLPTADAQSYVSDKHAASYRYLGQQGLVFNGDNGSTIEVGECQILEGQEVCPSYLVGWLVRKVAEYVNDGLTWVVDRVHEGIGLYYSAVKGEASLSIQFRLLNTDPLFIQGADTAMRSAWRGHELMAAGMKVHVRQGLAAFFATTGAEGDVTLPVAKDRNTRICLQAENRVAKLTEFIGRTVVCFDNIGKLSGDRSVTVNVKHHYFNVLAQMTDAADYVQTVLGNKMGKISVLVGATADKIAVEGAFTPCMGRLPGAIGLITDLIPGLNLIAAHAEFFMSVDMVMPSNSTESRGVGVHEYGHAVMCDMLAKQGTVGAIQAWHGVVQDTLLQNNNSENRYIAEAFADFITSQVVGGTNYFTPDPDSPDPDSPDGSNFYTSDSINYCKSSDSECLDYNFTASDISGALGLSFNAQIRRVASILHDVFDSNRELVLLALVDESSTGYGGWSKPNDGSHWDKDIASAPLQLSLGNYSNTGDEMIELDGADIFAIFSNWADRGYSLSEANFLGAVVDTLRERSIADDEICELFRLHSDTGDCPAYAVPKGATYTTTGDVPVIALDNDLDGVPDDIDNCVDDRNEDQSDTDDDGFGNLCDADLDNDGIISFADLAMMKKTLFLSNPNADLNGDLRVDFADLAILKSMIFGPPGPSGLVP